MGGTRRNAGAAAAVAAVIAIIGAGPRRGHPDGVQGACVDCHEQVRSLSHPVDVYPSSSVPGHLPLENGRLSCLTCHDLGAGEGAALLRIDPGAAPAALCTQCHDAARGGRGEAHALATGRAHLASSSRRGGSSSPGTRFDGESERCMSCHDGTVASEGAVRTGPPGPMNAMRLIGGQHPIGVTHRSRGIGDHLVPAIRLDPAIRLYDGRVGCGSCHSPYAEGEAMLVMSNERSRLCLACHDF